MQKIIRAHLVLGEPLPFSIYDENGRLLLRHGMVITMPGQIERILARGSLRDETENPADARSLQAHQAAPPEDRTPPFEQMGTLMLNLKHVIGTVLKSPEQIDLSARVRKMARAIQDICLEDVDSALAAPCLDFQNPYIVVHQMMGAVLTELIALRKVVAQEDRLSMICAALTRDLGQMSMQMELDNTAGPLSAGLLSRMHQHPNQSHDILVRCGVVDAIWLQTVRAHHERLNGSGYPAGLKAEQISLGARILAVADIYSAMEKPRPYRNKAHFPQNALKEIYLKKDAEIDGEMAHILINQIGLLPPGTIVKLKCGEIAVIKSPTVKAEGATVYSIYGKSGMVLPEPMRRETTQPGYEITGLLPYSECRSASIMIKRIWI